MTSRGLLLSLGLGLGLAAAPGCSHRSSPTDVAQVQAEASAIAVGAQAPEAQLVGTTGGKVALADRVHQHAQTVVVFYRGFW
ncbi:MAG TPA: hypothetical protein VHT91_37580 [Kofleriaceae bacterium]|jgi:hypothetical protein|nr:hypothetical protein [Kofleriaceae bacterium]